MICNNTTPNNTTTIIIQFRLGILLGTRLYHNFCNEDNWDVKIAGLVKEIGSHGKSAVVQQVVAAPMVS